MKALAWLAAAGLLAAPRQVVNFDAGPTGATPMGWTAVSAPRAAAARWEILRDQTAPTPPFVLAPVSATPDSNRFPLAVLDSLTLRDGDISVRLKPVSGREEQAAGLVWRYRDPKNFYLARMNALDNNVGLYRVVDGHYYSITPKGATPGTQGVHRVIRRNAWSLFKVAIRGRRFSVYVNHRRILQADDAALSAAGKVGLWTRGDTMAYFDDFRVLAR